METKKYYGHVVTPSVWTYKLVPIWVYVLLFNSHRLVNTWKMTKFCTILGKNCLFRYHGNMWTNKSDSSMLFAYIMHLQVITFNLVLQVVFNTSYLLRYNTLLPTERHLYMVSRHRLEEKWPFLIWEHALWSSIVPKLWGIERQKNLWNNWDALNFHSITV